MADTPATPSRARGRSFVWWAVAAAVLVAGYADLVRGGETIAPILLVLGYCVFVPLAILKA
jgi:hypothetical protein